MKGEFFMNLRQKKKMGRLARFTSFSNDSNWVSGTCGDYKFEAKLFDEGSCFGIDDGRVSKLLIVPKNGGFLDAVALFDRGWDRKPNHEVLFVYQKIMNLLENSPKRFT